MVEEKCVAFRLTLILRRPPRHLPALPLPLLQPNRDRLLASGPLFSRPAAFQLAVLAFVHRLVHFVLGFLSILGHVCSSIEFPVPSTNITAIVSAGLLKWPSRQGGKEPQHDPQQSPDRHRHAINHCAGCARPTSSPR